jgi:(5-formylfuran-3-yl)methyl phosphate synthase
MTRLLVSVRNAAEAEAALAGGAHVIDVKEPSRGPLGRADDATIAEVVRAVAGRRPVSAALGELQDFERWPECLSQLQFVKWGWAALRTSSLPAAMADWALARRTCEQNAQCEIVTVAYADALRADAPDVEELVDYVVCAKQRVLLLDTFEKDGRTLLDWLNEARLEGIIKRCRTADIRVALAGSLGFHEIRALKRLRPDWFAVRGAACPGRQRNATIDSGLVWRLVELLAE